MLNISEYVLLEQFLQGVVEGIKENIKNKQVTPFGSMHATGKAEDSLFYRIDANRAIVGSTWAYITVLEDGRRPGKFAPPEVIEKWIGDKPVTHDDLISKKSLAYLINKKLKEEGSLLWQQGGKSGVLSQYANQKYTHDNLTVPLKREIVKEVTGVLFKPATA